VVFVVAYDLVEPNDTAENYDKIISAIKSLYPSWCHVEQSVWLVSSPLSAADIRESLKPHVHKGDVLFVARLEGNWASWNFGERRNNWVHGKTF
jgi:hypothetical protein